MFSQGSNTNTNGIRSIKYFLKLLRNTQIDVLSKADTSSIELLKGAVVVFVRIWKNTHSNTISSKKKKNGFIPYFTFFTRFYSTRFIMLSRC